MLSERDYDTLRVGRLSEVPESIPLLLRWLQVDPRHDKQKQQRGEPTGELEHLMQKTPSTTSMQFYHQVLSHSLTHSLRI